MYLPTHFAESDPTTLHALIRRHPLATVVTQADDGLTADHIPLLLDPEPGPWGLLRGHVARANPLWRQAAGQQILVIFQGSEAYISPSWYPSKRDTGKVVPTWNYAVVHAHGPLQIQDDVDWLRGLVDDLTAQHEAAFPTPWSMADAPVDFTEKMLKAIVGIEIPIIRLTGKWKVSQNQPLANREGVVDGLHDQGNASAEAMAALVAGKSS